MNDMNVALIREIFVGPDADRRFNTLLDEARGQGADLAVLPELPMLPWRPAFQTAEPADAEPLDGPTLQWLSRAAVNNEIAILGGAIVNDAESGKRFNTALLVDAHGRLVATYRKLHPPSEPGFWEDRHYAAGDAPPGPIDGFPLRLGIQLCSDVYRPGSQILAGLGAHAILCPRASETQTFDRWRLMLRANAIAGSCYVLSVTRPRPEFEVPLGGPSIAIDPHGEVINETEETVIVVPIHEEQVERSRLGYPGHLAVHAEIYARGWGQARPLNRQRC